MKISELMERLGELQGEHGDVEVELELTEDEFGTPTYTDLGEILYEPFAKTVFITIGDFRQ